MFFFVWHFHLFSRKASKIKNFSLIPTSWYYLPKIPITAVALLKAKDDPNLSHFYHSLVERRKYKRALIEGVQARDLLKLISDNKEEFYKNILDYKGKVVIGEVELNTSIDKIKIERKMGNRSYYKDLREEEAVTIPPGRHRIYIGAYNDDTSNKITEYFKKEYNLIIQFRN